MFMKKFKKIKRPNVFTMLVVFASFAVVFKLVDIVNVTTAPSVKMGNISVAQAVEHAAEEKAVEHAAPEKPVEHAAEEKPAEHASEGKTPEVVNEQPPPLTEKEIEKAKSDKTATEHAATEKPAEHGAEPAATGEAAVVPDEIQPPPSGADLGEQTFSPAEVEVLQSLSKRRDELDKRQKQIDQRESLLKVAESEVDRKISELNKIKKELEDLLGKQQTAQDERMISLVKIYEGMKPKEAARIFDTLDMSVLLPVISRMKENKTAPVLAAMDPEKARQVTIKLAEQRKLPNIADEVKKESPKP
jgi:flagellar motility protein MotE (MotC chaperone)